MILGADDLGFNPLHAVKKAAKAVSPPWEGTGGGGWVTRLGRRLALDAIPVANVMCNLKKYKNSRACVAVGSISWAVGKRAIERVYGLPNGSLDAAEKALNGPEARNLPPEVRQLLVTRKKDPTVWEQFLDAMGLR